MNRRDFIKNTAAFSIVSIVPGCINNKRTFSDYLVFANASPSGDNHLVGYNPKDPKSTFFSIKLPSKVRPHSFTQSPLNKNQIYGADRWGKYFFCVDLDLKKVTSYNYLKDKDNVYNGHFVFSLDHNEIYTSVNTKSVGNTKDSYIVVLDSLTLVEKRRFFSHGAHPHEITLINDKKTLLVLNPAVNIYNHFDGEASIAFINLKTQKLQYKLEMNHTHYSFGHLSKIDDNSLLICGADLSKTPDQRSPKKTYSVAAIINSTGDYEILKPHPDQNLSPGMFLSPLADTNTNTHIITSPHENKVFSWNLKTLKPIKSLDITSPLSISMSIDKKEINIINSGGELFRVSTKDYSIINSKKISQTRPSSHSITLI